MTNDSKFMISCVQSVVNDLYTGQRDLNQIKAKLIAGGCGESEVDTIIEMATVKIKELLVGKSMKNLGNGIVVLIIGLFLGLLFVGIMIDPQPTGHFRHAFKLVFFACLFLVWGFLSLVSFFKTKSQLKDIKILERQEH